MQVMKTVLISFVLMLVVFSCSKTLSEEEYYIAAKDAFMKENYKLAIENFGNIVTHYPQGKRAAEANLMLRSLNANSEEEYYEAAKEAYTKEFFVLAVKNFDNIIKNYPQGKRAAEASFMLGFINANDIKDYDAAKKYYEDFIKKYPKHELADDAQYELETLGKDINDLPIFKKLSGDSLKK